MKTLLAYFIFSTTFNPTVSTGILELETPQQCRQAGEQLKALLEDSTYFKLIYSCREAK